MDRFLPNPTATTPDSLAMFEFLGQLMGIAIRTKCPLELSLPSLVWKPLVGDMVGFTDVEDVDEGARLFVSRLQAMMDDADLTPSTWSRIVETIGLRFTTTGFDGSSAELIPGGSTVPVMWDGREEYLHLLKAYRQTECSVQVAAIARGLASQVPRHLLSLFTWQQLELMVCGRQTVDLELLQRCTVYGERLSSSHTVVRNFWATMQSFSEAQRVSYLRFVWGRSRLPLTPDGFARRHKLSLLHRSPADAYLPVAHTCFFSIDLPAYSNRKTMRDKLLCSTPSPTVRPSMRMTRRQRGRLLEVPLGGRMWIR